MGYRSHQDEAGRAVPSLWQAHIASGDGQQVRLCSRP
nr:MAG TPA: hypothetical protein [Caudoviricetes sp.]